MNGVDVADSLNVDEFFAATPQQGAKALTPDTNNASLDGTPGHLLWHAGL
jgi:hypothetical protein